MFACLWGLMKRQNSKTNTEGGTGGPTEGHPTDAKRVRMTRSQVLMAEASRKQIAQRNKEGRGVDAVPTFSRAKTATSSSARTHMGPKVKPISPIHNYNFRQGTPPPSRFHAGSGRGTSSSSTATGLQYTSNIANRLREVLPPNAIEQTVCFIIQTIPWSDGSLFLFDA